jgi:hypothetical protein
MPFEMGIAHYDDPPPEAIDGPEHIEELRAADRFRIANRLHAWVEVEDGRIVRWGQEDQGAAGGTTLRLGKRSSTFAAVALPTLQPEPKVSATSVTFRQTSGGRTGVPAPRRVRRKPFIQYAAPLAWSTLSLTINADGSSTHALVGASPFPRHWVYDPSGKLSHKTGLTDFKNWYRRAFGRHSPWGDQDSPALVTEVETALERELSLQIMRGGSKPEVRKLKAGATLAEQGAAGDELFVLLDGVLRVEHDGERLTELGPGAVLGERAILEGGVRTSTLRAVTPCKVAVARADQVDKVVLEELSKGHRREEKG